MKLRAVGLAALLVLGCGRARDAEGPGPADDPMTEGPVETPSTSDDPDTPDEPPGMPTVPPPTIPEQPRDCYVCDLLDASCGDCHNEATCPGSFCVADDIDALIEGGWIVPGKPNSSPFYTGLVDHPPPRYGGLSEDELQDIAQYIAGLRAPEPACQLPYPSWDQLYAALQQDLFSLPAEARPFTRYLSTSNSAGAGACEERMATLRAALDKFINSISQGLEVRRPTVIADAVGSGTLFRIDLRDYALDASRGPFVVLGAGPHADGWEAIIANNDYAVEFTGPNADAVALQTLTTVPVLFVDALIDRATVGDLYAGLLRLGDTRQQVLSALGVDPEATLADRSAQLAGITGSGVSIYNRIAVRNVGAATEYYYENFEVDPGVAGNTAVAEPFAFRSSAALGSEVLFRLPNGFQAFLLFDEQGNRLEESPLLFDNLQNDNVMRNAISCFGCHTQGPNAVSDEVRAFALANAGAVTAAAEAAGFDYQAVLELYSDAFASSVAIDASGYQNALASAGVPLSTDDPITSVFVRFDSGEELADLAGDLLVPSEVLESNIPRLEPALSGLDDGFSVDRDDAGGLYVENLCILLDESQNKPAAAECAAAGL